MKLAFPISMGALLLVNVYFADQAAKTAGTDTFDRNIRLADTFQALAICAGLAWVAVAA